MNQLTPEQYAFLVRGIDANRVGRKQGQAHVEAWDIRRHLIRAFGFGGFDIETIRCDLVKEIETKQGERSRWTIVYRAEVRLTIKATDGTVLARYEDGATGDAINQPSVGDAHDFAMKTALSQALKRCAVNLGDQFGLGLYNGGNMAPVVHRSLVCPTGPANEETAALPADDAPVMPEPGMPAAEEAEHVSTPPIEEPVPLGGQDRRERPVEMVGQDQHRTMHALWRDLGYSGEENRTTRLAVTARILGLPELDSSADLTRDQAQTVIAKLRDRQRAMRQQREQAA